MANKLKRKYEEEKFNMETIDAMNFKEEATYLVKRDLFPNEANQGLNYRNHIREYGNGPCKIDTFLTPQEDVFSLLLASCFKTDLIEKHLA